MAITYRPAAANDVAGIVAAFLDCWRDSYAAVLPARLVARMTDERANDLWTRVLEEAAPGEVIVAESDEASGPVILGVTRYSVEAGEGMVHSLYVSPLAQGRGVGTRLLNAAADALAEAGVVTARLWVFRDNAPSLAFYRRNGWIPDGRTRVQDDLGEPEIRLGRNLAEGRAALNRPAEQP
jgi:GNAT superfamily N-acetyltransferase